MLFRVQHGVLFNPIKTNKYFYWPTKSLEKERDTRTRINIGIYNSFTLL